MLAVPILYVAILLAVARLVQGDPARNRRTAFQSGWTIVAALALGALDGLYRSTLKQNWAARANGEFTFIYCRGAAIAGALVLGLFALVNSAFFARLEWLLPVRGRWARRLLYGTMAFLGLAAVFLLIIQPIA